MIDKPCFSLPVRLQRLTGITALLAFSTGSQASETINSQLTQSLIRTTGMLALVIACILALTWLIKKLQYKGFQSRNTLEIVETLHLGRNEKLCIAKIGNSYQVLGITAHNISVLQALEQSDLKQTCADHPSWQWARQLLQQQSRQQAQQ